MMKMKEDSKALKLQKDESSENSQHGSVKMLQSEVKILRREIEAINNSLNVQYEMLEDMESAISASSVEFDCEICNFKCKKESTLSKHINTKHSVKSKVPTNIDEREEKIESNDNFR